MRLIWRQNFSGGKTCYQGCALMGLFSSVKLMSWSCQFSVAVDNSWHRYTVKNVQQFWENNCKVCGDSESVWPTDTDSSIQHSWLAFAKNPRNHNYWLAWIFLKQCIRHTQRHEKSASRWTMSVYWLLHVGTTFGATKDFFHCQRAAPLYVFVGKPREYILPHRVSIREKGAYQFCLFRTWCGGKKTQVSANF